MVCAVAHVSMTFVCWENMAGVHGEGEDPMDQAAIPINLQKISNTHCDTPIWCFSIAFNAASNCRDVHIELKIRIRVPLRSGNLHMFADSLNKARTKVLTFDIVSDVQWSKYVIACGKMLFSVATNNACNIIGWVQIAVLRFESVAFPKFSHIL